MTWKTSFDYQMSGINVRVSNAMIKALMEVVKNMTNMFVNTDTNYNGTHYNSSGDHNMTGSFLFLTTFVQYDKLRKASLYYLVDKIY